MVLKFKDLESKIPENIYVQAELLLDKNQVSAPTPSDKNLYLYQIIDSDKKLEVEILATKTQSKSYSCDCESKTMCSHIAAALLRQRKYFRDLPAKRKKTKPNSKNKIPDKLSVDVIFDTIEPDDLKAFIKNFAKSNSKFALALQVNFARRVKLSDNQSKYRILVDKMLKPLKGNSKYYTVPAINQFLKNSKELIEQFKDAVSLKSFVEATTILTLIINKSAYALSHLKLPHEKLEIFFFDLHDKVEVLLNLDLAPELRDQLITELLHTISLSYYPFQKFHTNIAQLIMKYGKSKEKKNLTLVLYERLEITKDDLEISNIISLILVNQHKKTIDQETINAMRSHHLQQVYKAVFSTENFDLLARMTKTFRKHKHLQDFAYDDINILLARRSSDMLLLAKSLADKYLRVRDSKLLDELLDFDLEISENQLRKIYNAISGIPAFAKNVMSILFRLKEYNLLVDFTVRYDQYKYFTPYINEIADYDPNLIELYIRKYIDKSNLEPMVSHRNHVYLVNNADHIFNDRLSMKCLNELKTFKELLIEETS